MQVNIQSPLLTGTVFVDLDNLGCSTVVSLLTTYETALTHSGNKGEKIYMKDKVSKITI